VTPRVPLNVPLVADRTPKVVVPVTPRVLEKVPVVADKAAIVEVPVTPRVPLNVPFVALKEAIVDTPVTDKVDDAAKVVKDPAAGVVEPIGGGDANIGVIFPGTKTVFAPKGVEYGVTASALVAR